MKKKINANNLNLVTNLKRHKKSLFIFRRDLRLHDNIGLKAAHEHSHEVVHVFIFDPQQIKNNVYKSDNAIQFMVQSLIELQQECQKKGGNFYFFYEDPQKAVEKLIHTLKIDAVYFNTDYTPFSKMRDEKIKKVCAQKNIACEALHDALLTIPGEIMTQAKMPYTVFTPFYKSAFAKEVAAPTKINNFSFYIGGELDNFLLIPAEVTFEKNESLALSGGRKSALKILEKISSFKKYTEIRDFPWQHTTLLSAYLKFGTVSVREVFWIIAHALSPEHCLIRQLYWRDFYTHIAFHFPHVFKSSFRKQYENMDWHKSSKDFAKWCEGQTGFPIVDAGMRELNATGFMHNRVRMIVASFLVKDLHINWQLGEKYFAQKLVDYDPAINNGNWQWCASTGCDPVPYFRIFNPWTQQKKFDENALYIKKWVPELAHLTAAQIHAIEKKGISIATSYPKPMVDHTTERLFAIEQFKSY